MKTICTIQARHFATRLNGKIAEDICGKPMLGHVIDRIKMAETVDMIIIATTKNLEDEWTQDYGHSQNVMVYRGDVNDVLGRVVKSLWPFKIDAVVHVTADNPLVEPHLIDCGVRFLKEYKTDFVFMSKLPVGVGADVFSTQTLRDASRLATKPEHREHVNEYFFENLEKFNSANLSFGPELQEPNLRLTVDTKEDLEMMRKIYAKFYDGNLVNVRDVIKLYRSEPEFFTNSVIRQRYGSERERILKLGL